MYILSIISLSAVSSHSCGLECSSRWLSILPTDESICETRERRAETEQRWPTGRTFCNIQEFHLLQTLRPPAKLKLFLLASVFLGFGYVSVWFTPRQRNTSGWPPRPPPTRHSFLLYDMFWCLQCLLFLYYREENTRHVTSKKYFFFFGLLPLFDFSGSVSSGVALAVFVATSILLLLLNCDCWDSPLSFSRAPFPAGCLPEMPLVGGKWKNKERRVVDCRMKGLSWMLGLSVGDEHYYIPPFLRL